MQSLFANTFCFIGIKPHIIKVEVSISNGLPCFNIIGLGDKAVLESKYRIKAVLSMLALALPPKNIVINLSPGNIPKEGTHYDLPIVVSLLCALGVLNFSIIKDFFFMGELSLSGDILKSKGILPAAIAASGLDKNTDYMNHHNDTSDLINKSINSNLKIDSMGLVCSIYNKNEAILSGNEKILVFATLLDLINHFKGINVQQYLELKVIESNQTSKRGKYDFADIIGQKFPKRCLEIAAAGGHNVIMIGPPGCGKSMLASVFVDLLPPLTSLEAINLAMILSLSNESNDSVFLNLSNRPFRSPHSSSSPASLIGGGVNKIHAGDISLAHCGVLFMDEFVEFSAKCIEGLRQPLESHYIEISRVMSKVKYPARFQLIAAMNQCKCGKYGVSNCSKAPVCVEQYINKISGPIMDRIDIKCNVKGVKESDFNVKNETTSIIKQRVFIAREIQKIRYLHTINANKNNIDLQNHLNAYNKTCFDHKFKKTLSDLNISMRSYVKILNISRTIQDLKVASDFLIQTKDVIKDIDHYNFMQCGFDYYVLNKEEKQKMSFLNRSQNFLNNFKTLSGYDEIKVDNNDNSCNKAQNIHSLLAIYQDDACNNEEIRNLIILYVIENLYDFYNANNASINEDNIFESINYFLDTSI